VPRDEAYYGDPGANHAYSRREYKPLAWIPELLSLKTRSKRALPDLLIPIRVCRGWATTPYSVIFAETGMTVWACMRMRSRKWGR
jgi:hypothetical protein